MHSAVAGEQGDYTTQAPGEKQDLPSFDQHLGGRDTSGHSSHSFQQQKLKPYAVAAIHAITERDSQSWQSTNQYGGKSTLEDQEEERALMDSQRRAQSLIGGASPASQT